MNHKNALEKYNLSDDDLIIEDWNDEERPTLETSDACSAYVEECLDPTCSGTLTVDNARRAVSLMMKRRHITKSEIIKISGLSKQGVYNFFNEKRTPRLDTFFKVMNALNLHFKLSI